MKDGTRFPALVSRRSCTRTHTQNHTLALEEESQNDAGKTSSGGCSWSAVIKDTGRLLLIGVIAVHVVKSLAGLHASQAERRRCI